MSNVGRQPVVVDPETGYATDTGCDVSPSCLRCPLPQCKHDDPVWYLGYLRRQRNQVVATRMKELDPMPKTQAVSMVAVELGIDPRTVYRRLAMEK